MPELPQRQPDTRYNLSTDTFLIEAGNPDNQIYWLNSIKTRNHLPIMQGELGSKPAQFLREFHIAFPFTTVTVHNQNLSTVSSAIDSDERTFLEFQVGSNSSISRFLSRFYDPHANLVLQLTALPIIEDVKKDGTIQFALSTLHPYFVYAAVLPFNEYAPLPKLRVGIDEVMDKWKQDRTEEVVLNPVHPISEIIFQTYVNNIVAARGEILTTS